MVAEVDRVRGLNIDAPELVALEVEPGDDGELVVNWERVTIVLDPAERPAGTLVLLYSENCWNNRSAPTTTGGIIFLEFVKVPGKRKPPYALFDALDDEGTISITDADGRTYSVRLNLDTGEVVVD